MIRLTLAAAAAATLACGAPAIPSAAAAQDLLVYHDPASRFTFSYPSSFGATSVGTDNGFENRVAAIRFSVFSATALGGEAVLGQGRPSLDVQAAGGLYDDILSGTLPSALKAAVQTGLPPLTRDNLCDQLARERHVDTDAAPFASLPAAQRTALASLDAMGNVAPRVLRCTINGDSVIFDKDAAVGPGGVRRRVYGVVRFLQTPPYSSFQLIRAGAAVDTGVIDEMYQLVASWRPQ